MHGVVVLGYVLFLGMPTLHLVDRRGVFDVAWCSASMAGLFSLIAAPSTLSSPFPSCDPNLAHIPREYHQICYLQKFEIRHTWAHSHTVYESRDMCKFQIGSQGVVDWLQFLEPLDEYCLQFPLLRVCNLMSATMSVTSLATSDSLEMQANLISRCRQQIWSRPVFYFRSERCFWSKIS